MTKQNLFKTLFIVFGVAILSIAGYLIWQNTARIEQGISNQQMVKPKTKPESALINEELQKGGQENVESEIDTSNWQVYGNEEYGYTIKYPHDWIIRGNGFITTKSFSERRADGYEIQSSTESISNLTEYDAQVKISFFKNPKNSFENYVELLGCFEKENIVISGIKSKLCKTLPEGFVVYTSYIPILLGEDLVSIKAFSNERRYSSERLVVVFKAMLSTFEFNGI